MRMLRRGCRETLKRMGLHSLAIQMHIIYILGLTMLL